MLRGVFPGRNALDEAIIVVGVEHHDAYAIQPAGPLERTGQRDIDQMPAARTEGVIRLGGCLTRRGKGEAEEACEDER